MLSMSRQIQHASRFLRGNDTVGALLAGIERNARLLGDIRPILPPPLSLHCLHAAIEQGTLVLLTDGPVWGSRLRFFAPELQRALRPRHGRIAACHVRVIPPSSTLASEPTFPGAKLSVTTVAHLIDAARIVKDEAIAAALRRLARTNGACPD